MSIDILKQELASLASGERSQILAYLVSLQDNQDADYRAALTRKIDESPGSSRWSTLEDLDRCLSS